MRNTTFYQNGYFQNIKSLKANPWNNKLLSTKNHFIAHWLLWRCDKTNPKLPLHGRVLILEELLILLF
jgi:hypothetical protein